VIVFGKTKSLVGLDSTVPGKFQGFMLRKSKAKWILNKNK
jgi:hypothetical protein